MRGGPPTPDRGGGGSADFGDLELGDVPRQPSSKPPGAAAQRTDAGGGMAFGELDFGGGDDQGGAIGVDATAQPAHAPSAGEGMQAAATAPVSVRPPVAVPRQRSEAPPAKRRIGRMITLGVVVLAVLGGAALQLTPYGAFGYLVIG